MERPVTKGETCSLTLRYQVQLSPLTTFSVKPSPREGVSPSMNIEFHPDISGVSFTCGADSGPDTQGSGDCRQELLQNLCITCVHSFSFPPEIVLAIASEDASCETKITRVQLPLTVATFLMGVPMDTGDFRQRWTAWSSSEYVVQTMVGSSEGYTHKTAADQGSSQAPRLEPSDVRQLLVQTLGMAEVTYGGERSSPGVELIAAAGALPIQEAAGSVSVPFCLVGVELHVATGAARVTTKSTDRTLAQGVHEELLQGLRCASGETSAL